MRAKPLRFPGMSLIVALVLINVALGQDLITPRIINGTPTDDFDSVGIVGTKQLEGIATGTLISPTHVLTAGHVGELVQRPTDGTFEVNGTVYTTAHIYVYPQYDPRTQKNDIAIFELSEAVQDVTPSAIYRDTPEVGEVLTLVGFGSGGNGDAGADGTFGVKMVGTTTIDAVGSTVIVWRFDNNQESNTAYGDSGGPAFLQVDGEYLVAGVTSGGTKPDSSIGDISFDTRVDVFAAWIDSIVLAGDDTTGDDDMDDNGTDDDTQQPACRPDHGKRPGGGFHPGSGFHPGDGKHPAGGFHPGGGKHPWGGLYVGMWDLSEPLGKFHDAIGSPLRVLADACADFAAPPKRVVGENRGPGVASSKDRRGR